MGARSRSLPSRPTPALDGRRRENTRILEPGTRNSKPGIQRRLLFPALSWALLALASGTAAGGEPPPLGRLTPKGWSSASPLPVRGLSMRVRLSPLLARVEVDQVFFNPFDSTLEAEYRLSLPPGARVTRLSMDVAGGMMEGELAARGRAREAYETIVRQKRDPALTEWLGGALFSTRVFPVFARSEKRILLEYVFPLPPGASSVRIPCPYGDASPALPWFELAVGTSGGIPETVRVTQEREGKLRGLTLDRGRCLLGDFRLGTELLLEWTAPPVEPHFSVETPIPGGPSVLLAVVPPREAGEGAAVARDLVILADSSKSVGEECWDETIRTVRFLLESRREGERAVLIAFDAGTAAFEAGAPFQADPAAVGRACRWLADRGIAGATHTARALREALAAACNLGTARPVEIVLVGDGRNTLDGDPDLPAVLEELARAGGVRLFCLGVGEDCDDAALGSWARRGKGRFFRFGELEPDELALAIRASSLLLGAKSFDACFAPLAGAGRRGEGILLAAVCGSPVPDALEFEAPSGKGKLVLQRKTATEEESLLSAFALLEKLEEDASPTASAGGQNPAATLSLRTGVLSSATAYIVLETAQDFERWGIARLQAARRPPPPPLPNASSVAVGKAEAEPEAGTPAGVPDPPPLQLLDLEPREGVDPKLLEAQDDPAADRAIEGALDWLARHQNADGSWSCVEFSRNCPRGICAGPGSNYDYDAGVTGLALLAFLNAWDCLAGPHQATVQRGIAHLLSIQDWEGGVGPRSPDGHWIYNHAICTQALARAAKRTGSGKILAALQRASDFLVECQNPYLGWRYGRQPGDSDSSVTGWAAEALFAAREAGAEVEEVAFEGAHRWFDKATDETYYRTRYTCWGDSGVRLAESAPVRFFRAQDIQERRIEGPMARRFARGGADSGARLCEALGKFQPNESLTAVAVSFRLRRGVPKDAPEVVGGLRLVTVNLPRWDVRAGTIDFYYWYWGTLAAGRFGGKDFKPWWSALRKALLENQVREGCAQGSWDPADAWGTAGGRVYATALNCLSLEIPRVLGFSWRWEWRSFLQTTPAFAPAARALEEGRGGDAAGAVLASLTKDEPGARTAAVLLVRVLLERRDLPGALRLCREAAGLRPSDAQLRLDLARLLHRQGEFLEAWREFRKAVALDPSAALRVDAGAFCLPVIQTASARGDRWGLLEALGGWMATDSYDRRLSAVVGDLLDQPPADSGAAIRDLLLRMAREGRGNARLYMDLGRSLADLGDPGAAFRARVAAWPELAANVSAAGRSEALEWIGRKDWKRGMELLFLVPTPPPATTSLVEVCLERFVGREADLSCFLDALRAREPERSWERALRAEFLFLAGGKPGQGFELVLEDLDRLPPGESEQVAMEMAFLARGGGWWPQFKAILSRPCGRRLAGRKWGFAELLLRSGYRTPPEAWPGGWLEEALKNCSTAYNADLVHRDLVYALAAQSDWAGVVRECRRLRPRSWCWLYEESVYVVAVKHFDDPADRRRFASERFETPVPNASPTHPREVDRLIEGWGKSGGR